MAVKFEQIENDTQTGYAQWEIRVEHEGVYEIVGTIEKNTCWCGDGYRADSYSVTVGHEGQDEAEACFQVQNAWRSKGMTAQAALAACKRVAKAHLNEE